MNDTPAQLTYDFGRLCRVFKTWYDLHGLSQSRVEEAGGPSGPVITKLYNGSWASARPRTITEKIDSGFGWPEGTAWTVLTRNDPVVSAGEEEEVRLLAAWRKASGNDSHERRRRREYEQFLNRQAAAVTGWIAGTVGAGVKTDRSYVESPGNRVEGGEHGDDTAAAIRAMREELRTLGERQARSFADLSARVERLERQQSAEPLDGPGRQG